MKHKLKRTEKMKNPFSISKKKKKKGMSLELLIFKVRNLLFGAE